MGNNENLKILESNINSNNFKVDPSQIQEPKLDPLPPVIPVGIEREDRNNVNRNNNSNNIELQHTEKLDRNQIIRKNNVDKYNKKDERSSLYDSRKSSYNRKYYDSRFYFIFL